MDISTITRRDAVIEPTFLFALAKIWEWCLSHKPRSQRSTMVGKRSLYHARGGLTVFRTDAHCIKAGFHFHRDHICLASTARLNASKWLQRSKQNWSKFTSHALAQENFSGWTRIQIEWQRPLQTSLALCTFSFDQKAAMSDYPENQWDG